jgi:choline dehydrogenase-like flavoprotein
MHPNVPKVEGVLANAPLLDQPVAHDEVHDRAGVLAAIRKGRELMATSPLKEVTGEEIAPGAHLQKDDELLDWVRKNAETTYHPVGNCKMGSDTMAVVDSELRVHGSRACGSPTPPSCRH